MCSWQEVMFLTLTFDLRLLTKPLITTFAPPTHARCPIRSRYTGPPTEFDRLPDPIIRLTWSLTWIWMLFPRTLFRLISLSRADVTFFWLLLSCSLFFSLLRTGLLTVRLTVFHLPARPARISHKIRRGRKVLKDVRPPDACSFRVPSPVSKKKYSCSVFYHGISPHLNCLL